MERLQGVIRKEWSFHGGKIVFFVKSSQTQIVIRVFLVEKPRFNEFEILLVYKINLLLLYNLNGIF